MGLVKFAESTIMPYDERGDTMIIIAICNCNHTHPSEPLSDAEQLLDLSAYMVGSRDHITSLDGCGITEMGLARMSLAVRLSRANKGTQLQALVEGWSIERVVKELY